MSLLTSNGSYVGGEKVHQDYMLAFCNFIQQGTAPQITDWVVKSNQYGGNFGTWVTLEDVTSGGPYMILIIRNDPVYSGASIKFRLTVDGTLIHTNSLWKSTTGTNHFIGLPFGMNSSENFPPVFARTSFKIEAYNLNSTARSEYAYCKYAID